MPDQIDDQLATWDEISEAHEWSSLLLGNGFSQNVWSKFGYSSLYEIAKSDHVEPGLTEQDVDLFEAFNTHNFEAVLSALGISKLVAETLDQDTKLFDERYESTRQALIAAVHHVHVPWAMIQEEKLLRVADELKRYENVYSSNYDLLVYWAVMQNPDAFTDFFFDGRIFDISNTEIWRDAAKVHFLHGGLHLYKKRSGLIRKRVAQPYQNLLDLFGRPFGDAVPLFVSEGTADEKRTAIARSDYLSFVFSRFAKDGKPLVVFGHSLGDSDEHLTDVLNKRGERPIAISIRAQGDIRQRKAALIKALPRADITFFDAATHPLGAPDLKVEDVEERTTKFI